jgi:hypothetical protein
MLKHDPLKPQGAYCAYLVRLWQDGSYASWRALAKNVLTEEEHYFGSIEELFTFLESQTTENQDREM